MRRFRKKPVEVTAVQWTGDNEDEIVAFAGDLFHAVDPEDRGDDPDQTAAVMDALHNTWVRVYDGQWIVRGVKGEFYPVAADVFAETYESVDDQRESLRRDVAETLGSLRNLIEDARAYPFWERGPQEYIAPCPDSLREVPHDAHDRDVPIESRVHCPGWPLAQADAEGRD